MKICSLAELARKYFSPQNQRTAAFVNKFVIVVYTPGASYAVVVHARISYL